jgi:hypothetical protein
MSHSIRTPWLVLTLVMALALALVVAPGSADAQDGPSVRIDPANSTYRDVQGGQFVSVTGRAPTGSTAISEARVRGFDAQGGEVVVPAGDQVWLEGDNIRGHVLLECQFADPSVAGCHGAAVRRVQLEVVVADQTLVSNQLRVDFTRPFIRRYELLAPPGGGADRIRVVFSEPVRNLSTVGGGDNPGDWRVAEPLRVVAAVENPSQNSDAPDDCVYQPGEDHTAGARGCTRILRLESPVGEDALPLVTYDPLQTRRAYEDWAGNLVLRGSDTNAISRAVNRVRPARPRIEAIDGKEPSGSDPQVTSNNRGPQVRLSNITQGHSVHFEVTRPDGSTGTTPATAAPEGGAVTVSLPDLAASSEGDGRYQLQAVVTDTHGNQSTDPTKGPGRSDAGPDKVSYRLDTIAPRVTEAFKRNVRELVVALSEPVHPDGNAGQWRINGEEANASGSGNQRVLTLPGAVPTQTRDLPEGELRVSWSPTEGNVLRPGTYRDAAGNGLQPLIDLPASLLPPLGPLRVTTPSTESYTRSSSAPVRGTAPEAEGATVELLERGSDEVRQRTTVSNGAWAMDVELPRERRYEFDVRLHNPETGVRTARIAVPDLVRDSTPPQVDVSEPSSRPLTEPPLSTDRRRQFAVGDQVTVRWRASDPADDPKNPDHGDRVDVDLRLGAEVRRLATGLPHAPGEERTYGYTLTAADLGGASQRQADFAVGVTDLAGNRGTDSSDPFLIIRDLVGYTAAFAQASDMPGGAIIEARFPVELAGTTTGLDWRVDGQPAMEASKQSRGGVTVVRIRTSQAIADPNATPSVRYVAPLADPLRDGSIPVSPGERLAHDVIAPVLSITPPPEGPSDTSPGFIVAVGGTTDETARPNTIRVHRADLHGNPVGGVVAQTIAGNDGAFRLNVPVTPNLRNRFRVEAIDPAGNRSPARSFLVIEASGVDDPPELPDGTPGTGAVVTPPGEDGELVVIIPPGAVDEDFSANLEVVDTPALPGYTAVTRTYQLTLETVSGRTVTELDEYAIASFRPHAENMDGVEPLRLAALRSVTGGFDELGTHVAGDARFDGAFLTPGRLVLGEAAGPTVRVFGADPAIPSDRFATAAGLSQTAFADASTVVLARADDYPDALTAAVLADGVNAPVLLANTGEIPRATRLEINRLGADRVILVGGPQALSAAVETQAQRLGLQVERVWGANRYGTAAEVAKRVGAPEGRAFLATGENFPDALSASSASAFLDRPIYLTQTGRLTDETLRAMKAQNIRQLDVVGGPAAVSATVERQLRAEGFVLRRLAGANRYETAVRVAEAFEGTGLRLTRPVIASGEGRGKTSPDALAAGPIAARVSSPLLLTPAARLHDETARALRGASGMRGAIVAGGPVAISEQTRSAVDATRR